MSGPEVIVFVGLPGAGKSTFYRQRFANTHALVSKDLMRNHRRPGERQTALVTQLLLEGRSVVVDNTSPAREDRAPVIALARAHGARAIVFHFVASPPECRARNERREGRARVPAVAIYASARRMTAPVWEEGWDEIFTVKTLEEGAFEVNALAGARPEGQGS